MTMNSLAVCILMLVTLTSLVQATYKGKSFERRLKPVPASRYKSVRPKIRVVPDVKQPVSPPRNDTNQTETSLQPGVTCGLNAITTATGQCKCPDDLPLGDPGFYCHDEECDACFGFGDPQIRGFNTEHSRIKFPCKVTLAQFDTLCPSEMSSLMEPEENVGSFSERDPLNDRCRFVVQSTTRMSPGGEYYTHSMDIKLVVNSWNKAENIWVHFEAGNVYYKMNGGTATPLGPRDCVSVQLSYKSATICHSVDKGIWKMSTPSCAETIIVFRPWDTNRENQLEVVGFGILTKRNADFNDAESKYPYSLCHVPRSSNRWYLDYYRSRGLSTRYGSFLYAFLLHPPLQDQPDDECETMTKIFSECPTGRHVGAVNTCAPILLDYALCATGNGFKPLDAFQNCMTGYCSNDDKNLCATAHDMISGQECPETPGFNCSEILPPTGRITGNASP